MPRAFGIYSKICLFIFWSPIIGKQAKNNGFNSAELHNDYIPKFREARVEAQKTGCFKRKIMSFYLLLSSVLPNHNYSVLELFAGAGGLAVGLEKSGLKCVALNEIDKWACNTLRKNRPHWNVLEGDIKDFNFSKYKNQVDVVTGGFPCQAFSYAGKKLGLKDARGTLFYEFARVVQEVSPAICIGENVRGLLSHEKGKTLQGMISIFDEIGYNVVPVQVLKAINYKVPQKRERLILVGIRKDIDIKYEYPKPYKRTYNLSDALKKGELFNKNVPKSDGAKYPQSKKKVLDLVPPKGYWRDLPLEIQKEYMGGSFYLGGGKTGWLAVSDGMSQV